MEFSPAIWQKSTHSATNASCVEVAVTDALVGVRDTKNRTGGTLTFDRERWNDFLEDLRGRS